MNKAEMIAVQMAAGMNIANIWGNLIYNVNVYGIQGAIALAKARGGGTIVFPPGTYNESFIVDSDSITLQLDGAARINGKVSVKGGGFTKSKSVSLSGDWTAFPVGKTTFSGNFSQYAPGDKVLIETTGQNGLINQIGVDFATVVTASSTQLVIDLSSKFAYYNPVISKLANARYVTGSIAADDSSVSGDYTSMLQVGDIVRIENRSGTGGVNGSDAYFELNKVVAIDNSKVTFENKFTHSFTNYWVVKLSYIKNINLTGGTINTLQVEYVTDFNIDKMSFGLNNDGEYYTISLRYLHEFFIDCVDVEVISKPVGFESVYNYNGFLSNIVASGARGETDNANLKIMSNINVVIDTLVSTDTQSFSAETVIPFFADYYYTPYKCWNDKMSIDSVTATGNKNAEDISKPDLWVIGVKNSTISNVTCNNPIRISNCTSVIVSNVVNDSVVAFDQGCNALNFMGFRCGAIDIIGSTQIALSGGTLTGKDATNSRVIFAHGTCSNISIKDIFVNTSASITIYLQDCDSAYIEGVTDNATGSNSVWYDVNVTNVRYGINNFKKLFPINNTSIAPTLYYGMPKGVIMPIFVLGRNSYAAKGNITGDGTAYKCSFDGDGLNIYNKNSVTDLAKFTVAKEAAGNYLFTGSIGVENVGTAHTLAELYIRKNNSQNYYLDYRTISTTGTIKVFLSGSVLIPLVADDYIELYVKVSGGTKVVTWGFTELGGQFAGTLLFAQ